MRPEFWLTYLLVMFDQKDNILPQYCSLTSMQGFIGRKWIQCSYKVLQACEKGTFFSIKVIRKGYLFLCQNGIKKGYEIEPQGGASLYKTLQNSLPTAKKKKKKGCLIAGQSSLLGIHPRKPTCTCNQKPCLLHGQCTECGMCTTAFKLTAMVTICCCGTLVIIACGCVLTVTCCC